MTGPSEVRILLYANERSCIRYAPPPDTTARSIHSTFGGEASTQALPRQAPPLPPCKAGFADAPGVLFASYLRERVAVDAQYAEMTGLGYPGERPSAVSPFGTYMAMLAGPDGHLVVLSTSRSIENLRRGLPLASGRGRRSNAPRREALRRFWRQHWRKWDTPCR